MSFQDFSSSRNVNRPQQPSGTATSTATMVSNAASGHPRPSRLNNTSVNAAPISGNSTTSSSSYGKQLQQQQSPDGILAQMSETIVQYQRNVGILERIVQSIMTTTTAAATNASTTANRRRRQQEEDELHMQYNAQVDVIQQLGEKIRRLLLHETKTAAATSNAQQQQQQLQLRLGKLQRDFEGVEQRALQLRQGVDRLWKARSQQQQQQQAAAQHDLEQQDAAAVSDPFEQMQLQMQQDHLHEEIMREREEEIRNINRGMIQVNEIYKDLAHLVGSQQEQVDTIETQMEESRANADAGLKQIEKANEKYGNNNCSIS